VYGSYAAMDLLLLAEGVTRDEALALRLGISAETVTEARSVGKFWDFALAYYPDFEPLYINCLTTQEALSSWAASQ
jgi:hypothetical protein